MLKRFLPLFLAGVVAVPASLLANTVVEEIVARVNNQIITRSEYQHEEKQLREEAQQQDPDHADAIVSKEQKDVLRGLIDRQLLLEKGKDLGISAETDVIKRLDEIRKQAKLSSMEDLEKAAQAQGVSFEDFKEHLRDEIITQKVIQQEVGPHINITNEEEHRFYEKHKAELTHPEGVRLSEILISTDDAGNDEQKLAADKAKAEEILKQLRNGASFEDLAKKDSADPSGAQGGDLGYFERGKLAKELEDITFAMKKGDVSDVIRTRQGFVILKVTDHASAGTPSFSEAEDRVKEALYMQKLQPALRAYLTKLREDAYIKIAPGFVDSGASPNETQPIVTNSVQEANAKELKKRKKLGVF